MFKFENYEGHTESHEQRPLVGNSATSNNWVSLVGGASSLQHVTKNKWYKMADNNVSFRQRAVIEFLVKEEIPAADIHHRLQHVYGDGC